MTEEQLKYFITIIDTGSYMETALELNIAQSSVSKQIQALERELGVQLFNRRRRHVKLTEEGKQLLPQARHILGEIHHLKYMAKKLQPGYKYRITVLTLPIMSCYSVFVSDSTFQ